MRITKIDNTQQFGALIRVRSVEELYAEANQMIRHISPEYRGISAGASSSAASSMGTGLLTSGSGVNTSATTSDVLATAFWAQASGVDSFGIVPSAIAKSAPYLTPQTVASTQANPSTAGSIFSTIGGWLHSHFRIIDARQKKLPS